MCTMISEKLQMSGSGKARDRWFTLGQAYISYDHPFHAPFEHALNLDFVNESLGPASRVAVELTPEAARDLAITILRILDEGARVEERS